MPRAALYLRVSSQAQADREIPIAGQETSCRDYAERSGLEVVAVYRDEGISGRTDQRPGFQQMISDASRGRFEAVIVWEVSRLSRVAEHALAYCARLQRDYGVEVRSVTQAFVLETPIGKLILTFLAGLAAYESDLISERTQRGMGEAARRGRRPGGTAPYGYRSEDAKLRVRADEAAVVRAMWRWVAEEGLGAKAVAARLNEQGIRTRRGGPWSGGMVHQLLCNPATRGHTLTRLYHSDPPELVERRGTHEALITEQEFSLLGWRLMKPDSHRRDRPRKKGKLMPASRRTIHALTGLLFCACGEPYVARGGTGRNGTYYHAYACRSCTGGRRLNGDEWERKIIEAVLDATLTLDSVAEAAEWWAGQRGEVASGLEGELREHEGRRRDLERQVQRLTNAIAEADIAPAPMVQGIQARHVEIAAEEAEIARLTTELARSQAPDQTPREFMEAWCAVMREAVLSDPALQKEFLRAVVDRIDVPAEGPLVLRHHLLRPAEAPAADTRGSNELAFSGHWLPVTDLVRTRSVA